MDHSCKSPPAAAVAELSDAVEDLLTRAGRGPSNGNVPGAAGKRDRRVAGRTRAVRPAVQAEPGPRKDPAGEEPDGEAGSRPAIVPMPIFDPFREAEKWREPPPPRAAPITRLS